MHSDAITDILIVLTGALIVVPLLHRFRVSSVLAYLAVGMVLGPSCLGAIDDPEEAAWLAELGVVFMLFAIGLELPLERLKTMRYYVFGLGSAQIQALSTLQVSSLTSAQVAALTTAQMRGLGTSQLSAIEASMTTNSFSPHQ